MKVRFAKMKIKLPKKKSIPKAKKATDNNVTYLFEIAYCSVFNLDKSRNASNKKAQLTRMQIWATFSSRRYQWLYNGTPRSKPATALKMRPTQKIHENFVLNVSTFYWVSSSWSFFATLQYFMANIQCTEFEIQNAIPWNE